MSQHQRRRSRGKRAKARPPHGRRPNATARALYGAGFVKVQRRDLKWLLGHLTGNELKVYLALKGTADYRGLGAPNGWWPLSLVVTEVSEVCALSYNTTVRALKKLEEMRLAVSDLKQGTRLGTPALVRGNLPPDHQLTSAEMEEVTAYVTSPTAEEVGSARTEEVGAVTSLETETTSPEPEEVTTPPYPPSVRRRSGGTGTCAQREPCKALAAGDETTTTTINGNDGNNGIADLAKRWLDALVAHGFQVNDYGADVARCRISVEKALALDYGPDEVGQMIELLARHGPLTGPGYLPLAGPRLLKEARMEEGQADHRERVHFDSEDDLRTILEAGEGIPTRKADVPAALERARAKLGLACDAQGRDTPFARTVTAAPSQEFEVPNSGPPQPAQTG